MESSDEDMPLANRKTKKPTGKEPAAAKKPDTAAKKKPAAKEAAVKKVLPKEATQQKAKAAKDDEGAVEKVKREKKAYDLPGQTKDTPPENDSLRKFYTSLLEQRPESEMAMKWCVQHGLLSEERAQEWLDKQPRRGGASPSKAGGKGPAKRKARDAEDVDDFKEQQPRLKKKAAATAAVKKQPAPAAKKQQPGASAKKRKAAVSEDEWSDEDAEEVVPEKKKRAPPSSAAANGSAAAAAKVPLIPRKQPHPPPASAGKSTRDVAFADGGMDSDSDDGVPLVARKPAAV